MANLAEIARAHTALSSAAIAHLQRLLTSWSLLSDLSFCDLLLYAPIGDDNSNFIVLGHTRSVTGATVHYGDPVGLRVAATVQPLLASAMAQQKRFAGVISRGTLHGLGHDDQLHDDQLHDDQLLAKDTKSHPIGSQIAVEYIPMRSDDAFVAVLTRETESGIVRHPSLVESPYRGIAERLAQMLVDGTFPYAYAERVAEQREPRVGDGIVVMDREGRIEYASPNAFSAMHRLGVLANLEGRRLQELGLDDSAVGRAFALRHSSLDQLEGAMDACVVMRCCPLIERGRVTGVVALLRDISDLRRRDRLLISKNTTIREINHRVKNSLQTIQSLLRLQTRRLSSSEAIAAIEASARRIGSIAMVHETLSTDASDGDVVDFDVVVGELVHMVADAFGSPERPLNIDMSGSIGLLGGEVAMPLAVVTSELLQNSIDHGSASEHPVFVKLAGDHKELSICVQDGGPGIPEGFSLDRDAGLGLTIVRTFVVADLGGRITFVRPDNEDDEARVDSLGAGTIVDVRVPRRSPELPFG